MKSFQTLDALRGWMAWWVVIGHGLHLMGAGTAAIGAVQYMPKQLLALLTSGHAAVMVFVILSGFVITHLLIGKHETYGDYLIRRFMRLMPIFLFCVGFAILIQVLYQLAYIDSPLPFGREMRIDRFEHESANLWSYLFLHLTLLHGVIPDSVLPYSASSLLAPAWSLSLEWQFYLIAPALVGLVLKGGPSAVLVAIGLVAAKYLLGWVPGLHWQYPSFFFLAGDLFLIGIVSRIAMQRLSEGVESFGWFAIAAALMIQIEPMAALIWAFFFLLTLVESGLVTIRAGWFHRMHQLLALNPAVVALGRWSYSTYLFHIPLFSVLIGIYVWIVGTNGVQQNVVLAILLGSMPFLALCSWGLYRWIEVPPIAWGRRWIARRKAQSVSQGFA